MMPELTLLCADKEYICKAVSVNIFRKYTEIMERNEEDRGSASAFLHNQMILKEVYGVSQRELNKADIVEQLTAAKTVHFMMQDIIMPKFLDLNPEHPEQQEASAFDEYDEENGYNDDLKDISVWKVLRENVDRIVKLCIRSFNDSYSKCMETDIISLLEYVAFEVLTINEK